MSQQLLDRFGRVHSQLRVSVTDRCNIRCSYCMPAEAISFLPRSELLTFEEITRLVKACIPLGIRKVRLTGGEPLVRAQLSRLVAMLRAIPELDEIALTTNAIHLRKLAGELKDAGLHRLNISLDTLSEETFVKLTRRTGLYRVLEGIQAAIEAGFEGIRLNAVVIPGVNETEVEDLVEYARGHRLEIRFIEFMPLDAEAHWQRPQVVTGESIRERIEKRFGSLVPVQRSLESQPATDFMFSDMPLRVGFIDSVTEPFCEACDRLRLTADGQFRNCLFSTEEWDGRRLLRSGSTDEEIRQLVIACVQAKKAGHGIDTPEFLRPTRAMYQIGG